MGIGALRRHRERLGKADQHPMGGVAEGGSVRHEYEVPEMKEVVEPVVEQVEESEEEAE
jgi:hypothetical protein